MTRILMVLMAFAPALLHGDVARAACTDAAAVAAVRELADTQCPCAAATRHGRYVKCVAGVTKAAVKAGMLPRRCTGAVVQCAASSICGRAGSVTCCRTNASGLSKCSIKPNAGRCAAPKGGAACAGVASSCCDTCAAGSCPVTATTVPIGTVTTTTTPRPRTHTVMVGQDGLTFTPATLTIQVGDVVHWVWSTSGHNVVSGSNGSADDRFCSLRNTDCGGAPLSNAGTTYDHMFTAPGSFPYFCAAHVPLGMRGTITVRAAQ